MFVTDSTLCWPDSLSPHFNSTAQCELIDARKKEKLRIMY